MPQLFLCCCQSVLPVIIHCVSLACTVRCNVPIQPEGFCGSFDVLIDRLAGSVPLWVVGVFKDKGFACLGSEGFLEALVQKNPPFLFRLLFCYRELPLLQLVCLYRKHIRNSQPRLQRNLCRECIRRCQQFLNQLPIFFFCTVCSQSGCLLFLWGWGGSPAPWLSVCGCSVCVCPRPPPPGGVPPDWCRRRCVWASAAGRRSAPLVRPPAWWVVATLLPYFKKAKNFKKFLIQNFKE